VVVHHLHSFQELSPYIACRISARPLTCPRGRSVHTSTTWIQLCQTDFGPQPSGHQYCLLYTYIGGPGRDIRDKDAPHVIRRVPENGGPDICQLVFNSNTTITRKVTNVVSSIEVNHNLDRTVLTAGCTHLQYGNLNLVLNHRSRAQKSRMEADRSTSFSLSIPGI
jgi:hypothetical protein